MKKHLHILTVCVLALLPAMPVCAQNSTQSKNRVAYIRKIYNEAQTNAKKSADNMVSVTKRERDDAGLSTSQLDFFYVVDIAEVIEIPYYKLNLLRRTCKGQPESYEEFLFDPKDESLIFYFITYEEEKGVKCETRYYFGAGDDGTGLKITKFIDTKTGKDVSSRYPNALGMPWDEGFLCRFAHDMQEAFNHLTLRGWD